MDSESLWQTAFYLFMFLIFPLLLSKFLFNDMFYPYKKYFYLCRKIIRKAKKFLLNKDK